MEDAGAIEMSLDIKVVLLAVIALVFLFVMASFVASFYRKCPPNQAMIISGMGCESGDQQFKIIVGGGEVVVPVIQQVSFLSLEVMKVKIHGTHASRDQVPLIIEAIALVRVRSDSVGVVLAATQLLSKSEAEVAEMAQTVLLPKLRDVVHSCDAQTLFDSFSDTGNKVKEKAEPELTAMGLSCSAFTIQSVTNETGVSASGVVKSPARSEIL
jgi:uncharacterized membrane protein YqiK